jgi:hypothetical protein
MAGTIDSQSIGGVTFYLAPLSALSVPRAGCPPLANARATSSYTARPVGSGRAPLFNTL